MTEKYRVFSGDNFHSYDNDDGVDDGGSYETQEEAVAAAKLIVDKSLRWERKLNKNPADPELYDRYMDFGDDPVILPDTEPHFFSMEICKGAVRGYLP